ncbi:DegT/DnrJ/EryC1/StrS family aminotransferase [Synechococcus sp. CC9311]|uniref:DegT/DnrJ/EryC1/StrS family aminotransferase n=1 Tax=Synechococcus sp. (strain CC9311) TaxID=64471 RepID=UPI0002D9FEDF|nr:DegT/DnrJ/EryC1/StrS family aminotransferase [Synechococcus sp. CC9311]
MRWSVRGSVIKQKINTTNTCQEFDSLRAALVKLEASKVKLIVVIGEHGQIVRTVSDGDIRRALISGMSLDDSVSKLPTRNPVVCQEDSDESEVVAAMNNNSVNTIIQVDSKDLPVFLINKKDLEGSILLSSPHLGESETNYVQDAIDSNWIAPIGPYLNRFEQDLSAICDRSHAIAVASGTAGLHLAIRALMIKQDKRIYVSDLTFIGSVQPILIEKHEPVFIDCEPGTWNMSTKALERQLKLDKDRNRLPGAIIVVHLYGQPANILEICKIANAYDVPIIEDAAESLGATVNGEASGCHGLISVYSFNGNKIITTSSGGAVVTNCPKIASKIRYLATQGRDNCLHYQHSSIAYNYRMSNVLAALGVGQLEVLKDRVKARRNIFSRYVQSLTRVPGISFQQEVPDTLGNRWITAIEIEPRSENLHPFAIMKILKSEGIDARPGWKPMHMQPICYGYDYIPHDEQTSYSERHFMRSICLPSGSNMPSRSQDRVISAILQILTKETN